MRLPRGIFVTGTGTEVGKTVASAWLMRRLDADYWKPVQSGLEGETDTEVVRRLTGFPPDRFHASTYETKAPLSPHESARREGRLIELKAFTLPSAVRPVVAEGAGGVLVPLNEHVLMIDLMAQLGLPVVIVALSGLGTINHTLLTLEALRARALEVAGVVMNGPLNEANRRAIEDYGRVRVIAEIPRLDPLNDETLATVAPTSSFGIEDFLQ
ncbi:MAG: dethiobiotin synthase [Alphaproteobacteria bacterium]